MAHAKVTLAYFVGALAETPANVPGGAQNGRASRVLELGCGQGRDAIALAQAGHEVTALDHSSVAINRATAIACHELSITWNLTDYVAGVRSCESATFDGVYSHLSLHYLSDNDTHELFDEIARVLKPGGLLLFTVRATDDPLHGRGDEIDAKRFLHRGHVRHFFEEAYVRALLSKWHEVDVHHYDTARQTINPGVFRIPLRRTAKSLTNITNGAQIATVSHDASPPQRSVTVQVAAGAGGSQGLPVNASRRASRMAMSCLRAVAM